MPVPEICGSNGFACARTIIPRRHRDARGFFSETWREDTVEGCRNRRPVCSGEPCFVACERHGPRSFSDRDVRSGIRCTRGSIFDVAVDIRQGSPTFGRHMAVVLSADSWKQLYIPVGFAHAYCTLEPDTEVIYKVSAYYDPKAERGLAWDDRDLAISWPVSAQAAILTERDREWPRLRELADCYLYSDWPD
jgi:dTDP-4-dehydrorhamnose 3,5-epimerase